MPHFPDSQEAHLRQPSLAPRWFATHPTLDARCAEWRDVTPFIPARHCTSMAEFESYSWHASKSTTNCTLPTVFGCNSSSSRLRAVRVGPFHSKPGLWQRGYVWNVHTLMLGALRIKASVGHAILAANGERIGYPPLHMHHVHPTLVHANHTNNWHALAGPTHGDFTEGDDYGVGALSARAYERHLPAGYCVMQTFPGGSPTTLDVGYLINDVRVVNASKSRAGDELAWWFEMAWLLDDNDASPCKPASLLWFESPRLGLDRLDPYKRYYVRGAEPSIVWYSGTMRMSGRLVTEGGSPRSYYSHAHRARYLDAILLAGSQEQLNITCSRLGVRRADFQYATMEDVARTQGLLLSTGRRVCSRAATAVTSAEIAANADLAIAGGRYDRSGALSCAPWAFRAGDPWTIAAFNGHAPGYDGGPRSFPQHTNFFLVVELDEEDAQLAMRQSTALIHFGGPVNLCHEGGPDSATAAPPKAGGGVGTQGGERAGKGRAPPTR